MSESTGTPAAPAAPAATPDSGSPPPSSQPAISVSEAARLLSQQRRQGAEGEAKTPAAPERRPSPNDAIAAAAKAATEAPKAEPAPTPDADLSPLERALGVSGEAPAPESAPQPANAALPGIIEIEGQQLRTLDEVREFARRKSADYTAKTQEIAERSRAIQAQQEALATVLPYIQPELAKLAQIVQSESAKPDISLMDSDPGRYFKELHAYEALREEQGRLANLNTLQSQAQERALAQQVAHANEQLAQEFPFWSDEAQRTALQHQIVDWATTKGGFQREELRNLADPRALKAMMKSMLFDKWVAGTRTQAPATMAPVRGAKPPAPPAAAVAKASEAFDAAPNIRNAAALLSARRGNGTTAR